MLAPMVIIPYNDGFYTLATAPAVWRDILFGSVGLGLDAGSSTRSSLDKVNPLYFSLV
jgi:hypothetical protein